VILLWDAVTGQEHRTISGPFKGELNVAFSPDGRHLAVAAAQDRTVRVWETATSREVQAPKLHGDPISGVAFSPDGNYVASSDRLVLRIWDTTTGQELHSLERPAAFWEASAGPVAFSPDSRLVASGSRFTALIWEIGTGRLVHTIAGHAGSVTAVAFSPDGRSLATASADRTVRLWDVQTGEERSVLRGHQGSVSCLSFHPSSRYLASGSLRPAEVKFWDLTRHPEYFSLSNRIDVTLENLALAFDADSRRVASVKRVGRLQVRDALTDMVQYEHMLPMPRRPSVLAKIAAFSHDGRRLVGLSSADPSQLRVWDVASGKGVLTLAGHTGTVIHVAFSRDGRRLASSSLSASSKIPRFDIRVWDALTGQALATFHANGTAQASHCGPVALSPDGERLAFVAYRDDPAGRDRATIPVYEVVSRRKVLALPGLDQGVTNRLAFSPDGERLAGASASGSILIWDMATGQKLLPQLLRGSPELGDLAWAPDGLCLATAHRDQVHLWDVRAGHEVLRLQSSRRRDQNPDYTAWIAWSPDGRRLAATNWDHTISIWDANDWTAPTAKRTLRDAAEERAYLWHCRAALERPSAQSPFVFGFHRRYLAATQPRDALSWLERCQFYAQLGHWEQAAADYAQALAAQPNLESWETGYRYALLRLKVGDRAGYRQTCDRLLKRWGQGVEPHNVFHVPRACVLTADALPDLSQPLRQAKELAAHDASERWFHYVLGAAQYRTGQFEHAVQAMQHSIAVHPEHPCQVLNWHYLAMAHHGLGQSEQARTWWAKARTWYDKAESDAVRKGMGYLPLPAWWDWLEAQELHAEAQALLKQAH
jgi:WD40 repeat protein